MVDTSLIYTSRIKECHKNIERDFQAEWSKKRFKWFFGQYRQKKLRIKIYHRYKIDLETAIDDFVDWFLPKATNDSIDRLVDVKDIALDDKVYREERAK